VCIGKSQAFLLFWIIPGVFFQGEPKEDTPGYFSPLKNDKNARFGSMVDPNVVLNISILSYIVAVDIAVLS